MLFFLSSSMSRFILKLRSYNDAEYNSAWLMIFAFNLNLLAMEKTERHGKDFDFNNCLGDQKNNFNNGNMDDILKQFLQTDEHKDLDALKKKLANHGNNVKFSAQGVFEEQSLMVSFALIVTNDGVIRLNNLKAFNINGEKKNRIVFGARFAEVFLNGLVHKADLIEKTPFIRPYFKSTYKKGGNIEVNEHVIDSDKTIFLDLFKIATKLLDATK